MTGFVVNESKTFAFGKRTFTHGMNVSKMHFHFAIGEFKNDLQNNGARKSQALLEK